MRNVLVVGGAGYVGGATIDALVEAGYRVRCFDNLLYEETYRKPIDFAYGDVRDHDTLRPHLDWADSVVWLAAIVGDKACALNPDLAVEVNQRSLQWLATTFRGRIVFTSTCSVYGAKSGLLTEESPLRPLSLYASTKVAADRSIMDAHANAAVFRLGTLFGVGDTYSRIRLDLVVNTLTARAFTAGQITIFGGDQFRPLLHVRDAAAAIVAAVRSDCRGLFNLQAVNMRISDIAEVLRRHFPRLQVECIEVPTQETRNYRVSDEKARRAFDFAPTRSVDDGIVELRALLEQARIKDVSNRRYSNEQFLAAARATNGASSHKSLSPTYAT